MCIFSSRLITFLLNTEEVPRNSAELKIQEKKNLELDDDVFYIYPFFFFFLVYRRSKRTIPEILSSPVHVKEESVRA